VDRPEWIGAALARGRSAISGVKALPTKVLPSREPSDPESGAKSEDEPETEVQAKAEDKPETEKRSEPGALRQRLGGVTETVRDHPAVAIAAVALALLVIVWIAWAIHVGTDNGGSAAVGVLITWPLLFLIAANLALLGIGLTWLMRYLQPSGPSEAVEEQRGSEDLAEEKDSDEEDSEEENSEEDDSGDEDSDDDESDDDSEQEDDSDDEESNEDDSDEEEEKDS
jgi:hypothetical protein